MRRRRPDHRRWWRRGGGGDRTDGAVGGGLSGGNADGTHGVGATQEGGEPEPGASFDYGCNLPICAFGQGAHAADDDQTGGGGGGGGWFGGGGGSTGGGGGGSGFISRFSLSGSFPGGTRSGDGKVVIKTP